MTFVREIRTSRSEESIVQENEDLVFFVGTTFENDNENKLFEDDKI